MSSVCFLPPRSQAQPSCAAQPVCVAVGEALWGQPLALLSVQDSLGPRACASDRRGYFWVEDRAIEADWEGIYRVNLGE